jgi:hypothetical protein
MEQSELLLYIYNVTMRDGRAAACECRQLLKRSGGRMAMGARQRTTKRWFLDLSLLASTCCGV